MKKNLFFIVLGVVGFSALAFLASRFSGIWLGVEILVLLAIFLVVSMTRTERLDDDSSSPTQDESSSSTSSATSPSPTNWGWVIGLAVVVIFIGTLLLWAPWESNDNLISPAISKADREMITKGWVELATPGPDEKDFWPVATPTKAVGKTTAVFQEYIIAERANGDVKKFDRPKKILVFSAGLNPGGLPDLRFAHPPSQGRIWAKFR